MTNINYDTGTINRVRQMGVFQLQKSLQKDVITSGKELESLASKTPEKEDDILARIVSQNFQIFANVDGKAGLSSNDLGFLMMSTDVVRNIGDTKLISVAQRLHEGIVSEIEKGLGYKIYPSRLVSEADAIEVIETEQGKIFFYASEGNIRVLKDNFFVDQRGIRLFVEIIGETGVVAEKIVELPIPFDSAITTRIRSFSVSRSRDGIKVDLFLDSADNRVMNGAKISYSLDDSVNLKRDNAGNPLMDITKLSSSELGRSNVNGLVSLGQGQYLAVQNRGKEGIFLSLLNEKFNGEDNNFLLNNRRTSIRNIKLGNVREAYGYVDLSNYLVRTADGDRDKIYVLLGNSHNVNQHILLVVDKNYLESSNVTMTEGFELVSFPSDVLGFSDIRNMSVNKGRIYFFTHPFNKVRGEDTGEVISLEISKIDKGY